MKEWRTVLTVGNSVGITLPSQLGLKKGDRVYFQILDSEKKEVVSL